MGGLLQKNKILNQMKLDKKEARQDDHPPGYPCRVCFFHLPSTPPPPSRMTVVDVSDFRDLQANGCGDQLTNSNMNNNNTIIIIIVDNNIIITVYLWRFLPFLIRENKRRRKIPNTKIPNCKKKEKKKIK